MQTSLRFPGRCRDMHTTANGKRFTPRKFARLRAQAATSRGIGTVEFILCFPLVLMVTLATVQFGMRMLAEQALATAAIAGAREAAAGGTAEEVAVAVGKVLAAHRLNQPAQQNVRVLVESPGGQTVSVGNEEIPLVANPSALESGEVRVTVALRPSPRTGAFGPGFGRVVSSDKILQACSLLRAP